MPSGVFPVPKFRPVPARTRPSLAVRILTRVRRDALDWRLAHGDDPSADAVLELRAEQLGSRAERTRLANGLEEALGDARRAEPVSIRSRASQRAQVRATADDLLALILRLRDPEPVEVRGVAMAAQLLRDADSPLRRDGAQDPREAILAARIALDPPISVVQDLAAAA